MLERHLLVWLFLSSIVAYVWPAGWTFDPFLASKGWMSYLIAAAMLSLGWLLPRDELRQLLRAWPTVLGGTALQYTSMPLLAFLVSVTLPLDDELRLGLIMVGCVPGAMASNVLTLLARGNVSYSLSLTTAATCLSPLCVPLALKLTLSRGVTLNAGKVVATLILTVVLPVVLGHCLALIGPHFKRRLDPIARQVAAIAILWIIAAVVGINRDALSQTQPLILLAIVVLNLGGYLAGWIGGAGAGLNEPMRRALTLEIGMQNAGVGTVLATQLFPDQPRVLIPTALYTFGCMATGTVLARYWARCGDPIEPSHGGTEAP